MKAVPDVSCFVRVGRRCAGASAVRTKQLFRQIFPSSELLVFAPDSRAAKTHVIVHCRETSPVPSLLQLLVTFLPGVKARHRMRRQEEATKDDGPASHTSQTHTLCTLTEHELGMQRAGIVKKRHTCSLTFLVLCLFLGHATFGHCLTGSLRVSLGRIQLRYAPMSPE